MATETIMFTSAEGLALEGRLAMPDASPRGGVVLCHPHPQFGGSMSSKLIPALQRALVTVGWAALRFNFRGVGRSEGTFDDGVGEVDDVVGALARIRESAPEPAVVVGWSFGALVGLNAVARDGTVPVYVGVAPPVRRAMTGQLPLPQIAELDRWHARSLIVCGTEDPFCRPEDAEELARHLPPPFAVQVIDRADHFFTECLDELGAVVTRFLEAE